MNVPPAPALPVRGVPPAPPMAPAPGAPVPPAPAMRGDRFLQTDDIFRMTIKSMVAKIFTTIGLFTLYNRPAKEFASNDAIASRPLRQILGGGAKPKVIPEAVECYIRLTLLGEWYRELFGFKKGVPADKSKVMVSMIPSFDGVWSRFVKVIFVDAEGVNDGGYTETFSEELVESINVVYNYYRSKFGSNCCSQILNAFVSEVNMRYGLILQGEIDKYIDERNKGLKDEEYGSAQDNIDYDILDSKKFSKRGPLPSDKFKKEFDISKHKRDTIKNKKFYDKVRDLRGKVESMLKLNVSKESKGPYSDNFGKLGLQYSSVDDLIRETKKRVMGNDTDEMKFRVVQNVIRGVDMYSDIDYDVFLMFHETVVNPLTILYSVYRMVNHWNKFANAHHSIQDGTSQAKLNALIKVDKYKTPGIMRPYYGNTIVNKSELLKETIKQLVYLTCDKNPMVEMYFTGSGGNKTPMLSFKKLEEHCSILVKCVEDALVKFRKVLPHEMIANYEKSDPSHASLFTIKEHLIDRLIKNKYGAGLSDSNKALSDIWKHVKGDNHGQLLRDMVLFGNVANTQQREAQSNWTKFPINKIGLYKEASGMDLTSMSKQIAKQGWTPIMQSIAHEAIRGDNMGFKGVYDYDDKEEFKSGDDVRGLIVKFNRMLYHMINMFTDKATDKIYLPLLERFANGVNAGEIMKGQSINDVDEEKGANTPLFVDKAPSPKSVVFTTMALAIKNIVTSKKSVGPMNVMSFAEQDLSNVSEYMKDLMMAYLPVFNKQLNIMCCQCELFKSLVEDGGMNLGADAPNTDVGESEQAFNAGISAMLKDFNGNDKEKAKSYMLDVLSHLGASVKSLQKCVQSVHKELNDVPLYFETYRDSITDYKSRNGLLPLMPLSHVSHLLNNEVRKSAGGYATYKGLVPHSRNGVASDEFKFAFGTRGLLADDVKPNIEYAPGVLSVMDTYNGKVGGGMSYDRKKLVDCFTHSTHLLRFATDYIYHKTYLCDNDLNKSTRFMKQETDPTKHIEHVSCQTGLHGTVSSPFFTNTTNIVLMVENDNYKQSVYKLLECVTAHANLTDTKVERKDMRIYNILDANIVPINFHALQRELPLINLFNYSYTFDEFMRDSFGIGTKVAESVSDARKRDSVKYSQDMLVQLLMDPMKQVKKSDFYMHVWSLMAGNDGLHLNTPKYLSDQLWNKVLLQSLHQESPLPPVAGVTGPSNALTKMMGWSQPTDYPDNSTTRTYHEMGDRKQYPHEIKVNKVTVFNAEKRGLKRYDSYLVRYIQWFVNIQRSMRLFMRNQLEWVSDPIVHRSDALSKSVTEYESNAKFDMGDYE